MGYMVFTQIPKSVRTKLQGLLFMRSG
jgi:hypothetical protein